MTAVAPRRSAPTPDEIRNLVLGQSVPAVGTGGAVNLRTGRTMAFDTPAEAVPATPAPTTPAEIAAPRLGTQGGIFENLVPFMDQRNRAVMQAARGARDINRQVKASEVASKQAATATGQENAVSNRLRAFAALQQAGIAGKKVTTDIMGNPVVTDVARGTALAPTVNKPVTEPDITATMKANKMTREQVLARLRQEGRID
jgi:hypothetical protein